MATPRVLILRAPGTNCDLETAFAFERAGAAAERLHVNRLLENAALADAHQILCIPGGFSYGDDVAAGKILANQVSHHLSDVFSRFREEGKLVLGICNGFQVLLKAGVLIPAEDSQPVATLAFNDSGRFEDRWVNLDVQHETPCVFLSGIERLELPIAHAEGKFVCRDPETLARLESNRQLPLRYSAAEETVMCLESAEHGLPPDAARFEGGMPSAHPQSPSGPLPLPYPANPNGSEANVAGVCDPTGRLLGLMPHPERHLDGTHHPRWTRRTDWGEGQGLQLFRNAVDYFA